MCVVCILCARAIYVCCVYVCVVCLCYKDVCCMHVLYVRECCVYACAFHSFTESSGVARCGEHDLRQAGVGAHLQSILDCSQLPGSVLFHSPDTSPCYNVSQEPPRSAPHVVMARLLINVWLGIVTWEEAVPAGAEGNWEWQLTVDVRSLSASWCMGFILKMQSR